MLKNKIELDQKNNQIDWLKVELAKAASFQALYESEKIRQGYIFKYIRVDMWPK